MGILFDFSKASKKKEEELCCEQNLFENKFSLDFLFFFYFDSFRKVFETR